MAPGSSDPKVGGSNKACYTPDNVVLNKVVQVTPRDNNSAWLTKHTRRRHFAAATPLALGAPLP